MKYDADAPTGAQYAFHAVLDSIAATIVKRPSGPPTLQDLPHAFAEWYLLDNMVKKREKISYTEAPRSRLQADLRDNLAKSAEAIRESETLAGFLARESVNLAINKAGIVLPPNLITSSTLRRARRIIRDILGSTPNLARIQSKACFGNGASASLRRADADRTLKWVHKHSCTRPTFELMRHYMSASSLWVETLANGDPVTYVDAKGNIVIPDSHVEFTSESVYDTVDKNVNIKRVILKEPELNGFIQKGIGAEIRNLLTRFGIRLNTSGSQNSTLAREGSISGHLATVDAVDASNSLTVALYELLFPRKWFELFMKTRTPYVNIHGDSHELQMMSGMGNGFTFEAESVIFYAIGRASAYHSSLPFAEEFVSIHGDDLIVPADVYFLTKELYEICGISVNEAKSFSNGPFRESCGGHWYNGVAVKPFYVKKETGLLQGDWFWLYNSFLLWLNDRNDRSAEQIQILQYIARYAVNMTDTTTDARLKKDISSWKIPPTLSRRAGIWSNPPNLENKTSWRYQYLQTISTKACTNQYGAYMQSLAMPMHVTVYDMILGRKPPSENPWEVDVDYVEAGTRTRVTRWCTFEEAGYTTPLWLYSAFKGTVSK